MKASKNSYLISIYLKSNQGKPITLVWQQDFQPTFPEITRKTVMHCVEKKYASDLLENTATAVVRMICLLYTSRCV